MRNVDITEMKNSATLRGNGPSGVLYGRTVVWLILIAACNLFASAISVEGGVLGLGLVGIAQSLAIFWTASGVRLLATSVFSFGMAMFIYFPAIYSYFDPLDVGSVYLQIAVSVALLGQLVSFFIVTPALFGSVGKPDPLTRSSIMSSASAVFFCLSIVFYGLLGMGARLPIGGREIAASLLILFAATASRSAVSSVITLPACGFLFLLYTEFMFFGLGRLVLGSLGLAIAICYAPRWRDRRVKLVLLVATFPVLSYMVTWRREFTAEVQGGADVEGSGIASILAPLHRFAQLIELGHSDALEYVAFGTIFASLVIWIPRVFWEGKPVGFGAELAEIFTPHLVDSGQSDAASFLGEAFYSFGWLGLFLAALLIGPICGFLDSALIRSESSGHPIAAYAIFVVLASGLVDLVWNGTFTFVSRAGLKVVVLSFGMVIFSRYRTAPAEHGNCSGRSFSGKGYSS